jgi:hypothetical protein
MIDIEKLELAFQQATERAIKIHDALDIPYVTANNNQVVEMLHGEVIRVIEPPHNMVNSYLTS